MSAAPPIVDAAHREAALDPARSFIVQAPAGSGKTGLLIQRYLGLLATVERPEEILAITFTRKAAAEMRRRVLEALEGARSETTPEKPNHALTWKLARAALERDRAKGWRLLENAARLRIQTIDSLCATLARQMPVLSGLGAPPAIVENAREHYREAAERTLALVEGGDPIAPRMALVLEHLDGDWAAVRGLLEGMIARRDQWLSRVAGFEADGRAREALEAAFRADRDRILKRLHALTPRAEEATLAGLVRFAADALGQMNASSPIVELASLARYPTPDEVGAEAWGILAGLLLTLDMKKPQFRKTVTRSTGFLAAKEGGDPTRKKQMEELLARLAGIEGLCEALHAVRSMPPPEFSDGQWAVLGAMVAILPRAAAELQLVFAERGEIDFTGIAQGAVRSLGPADEPTDLLLSLDVKLRHLLVDEFQDTSHGQWELFKRLTAGWEPDDGRTAFFVGDPMQSIYRFREADVALFLRARREGLPNVELVDVRLATNFRSQAGIVDWVNDSFAAILPAHEDPDEGAVPYEKSSAHHPPETGPAVQWHPFLGTEIAIGREREAQRVVTIVEDALARDAEHTVAILVRNRSNLDAVVPALKAAKIRFRAVDIEQLGGRQVIQDLLAITRALSHPADRIAWLGLLRAPWCAMTLADLHALTGAQLHHEGARRTVWELMNDAGRVASLSKEGGVRLERVRAILAPFVEHRVRGTLRERVEAAWLALGGPACAESASDLEDSETFFDQLDELERAGELPDPTVLEEHLAELYAASDTGEEARVQVMTIHKAKGLEFGTVIVPGMDRMPRVADKPLFAWKARADGTILMAPVRAASEAKEAAYDYLRALDKIADQHEVERLLYVAATRAEERLHLLGYAGIVTKKDEEPRPRAASSLSLLGKAWVVAREPFDAALPGFLATPDEALPEVVIHTELRRLDTARLAVQVPEPACRAIEARIEDSDRIEFSWAGEIARHVGTITHGWLQRIAAEGLGGWDIGRVSALAPRVARELARLGLPPEAQGAATAKVVAALQGAISDERGRWVLGAYPDARSEHRIRVPGPDGVRLLVIDRTFTDAGRRWIVDYKTSSHEGGDLEAFLDRERQRYGAQMERYRAALGGKGALGLYFPLVRGWREW